MTTAASPAAAPLRAIASNYLWVWDPTVRHALATALGDSWTAGTHPLAHVADLDDAALTSITDDPSLMASITAAHDIVVEHEATTGPVDVAYLSPEFGVSETLPQYSGGLGILAGDHLKAASDLRVPLVAVGLFYANGYFTQGVDDDGQTVSYEKYEPADLGLEPTGAVVTVETPRGTVRAAVWLARIGAIRLYLLDCRTPGNPRWARAITDRLYGGDQQRRIDQEWLLGVGGWRALQALGIHPATVHLNEGHAGFLLLELLAEQLAGGASLSEAIAAARARTLFTTHTPVPAGIDRFPQSLLEPYLATWAETTTVEPGDVFPLGLLPSDDDATMFNMAAFCLRLSGMANGVAQLHGEVSRELFSSLPESKNITAVTNGIHARTWVDPVLQGFFDEHLGAGWAQTGTDAWAAAGSIDSDAIRNVRTQLRHRMVDQLRSEGFAGLQPDALTIGFARRFATYKRAALLLRERDALIKLLASTDRPVQFVFAGKAHPADTPGQALLAEIHAFSKSAEADGRLILVPGYDMRVASMLYSGCDVWLNNPVRPQEACGTSGEKAALNGGLNCSIADGWWAEWYHADNGWALPTSDLADPEARDAAEAKGLLATLADEVVPTFFDGGTAISEAWLDRIRFGWTYLGPKVTAGRMVAEYRDRLYLPLKSGATSPG